MKKVEHLELKLAYEVYGSGSTVVLALHGHSRSPDDFKELASSELKIIAPSLFHHGHSEFPKNRINKAPIKSEELELLLDKILEEEQVQNFHLIAYSQGGRFALKMLEYYPKRIHSVNLLAPDGINLNGVYDKATRNKFNRLFMKLFEKQPFLFKVAVWLGIRFNLASSKFFDLAKNISKSKRQMLLASETWRNFRELQSEPRRVGELVKEYNIPFQIIMGEYDGIFPPRVALKFAADARLQKEVVKVIKSGHNFFKQETIKEFLPLLPFKSNGYICLKDSVNATHP
jgi:pimeloyl-ACP methyl ester carboxylesterase